MHWGQLRVLEGSDKGVIPEVVQLNRSIKRTRQIHIHIFVNVNVTDLRFMIALVTPNGPIVCVAANRAKNIVPNDHITALTSSNHSSLVCSAYYGRDCG